jgi:hypothetical protein
MQGRIRPKVRLNGEAQHPDFREAVAMLSETAELVSEDARQVDLVVIAQSRPGVVARDVIDRATRELPLAGVVALLGSWCEGETRTGRPWLGVPRLYWYTFPAWWREQLALLAKGRCPNWARREDVPLHVSRGQQVSKVRELHRAVIALHTQTRETSDALSDALGRAGFATVRQSLPSVRGVAAGVWEGGQLDEYEARHLSAFSARLRRDGAPVVAILDFPRRDRVDLALSLGASAVVGKPWVNEELLASLSEMLGRKRIVRAA